MFTGLVADIGTITDLTRSGDGATFEIETSFDLETVEIGESIAIDGACLTVTEIRDGRFTVDASPETLERTTLGRRRRGDGVHLERALAVGDRLGGHMVLGHVDGVGTLTQRQRDENAWLLDFEAPDSVAEFLIEKGSVAVDGVSLTVNWVDGKRFGVAIIPHTAERTNLADYRAGRRVNLEADVLGKYVKKFVTADSGGVTMEKLSELGFGEG